RFTGQSTSIRRLEESERGQYSHALIVDHDVGGPDVAVHNILAMQICYSFANFSENFPYTLQGLPANSADNVFQGRPIDIFHDQIMRFLTKFGGVHFH